MFAFSCPFILSFLFFLFCVPCLCQYPRWAAKQRVPGTVPLPGDAVEQEALVVATDQFQESDIPLAIVHVQHCALAMHQ